MLKAFTDKDLGQFDFTEQQLEEKKIRNKPVIPKEIEEKMKGKDLWINHLN